MKCSPGNVLESRTIFSENCSDKTFDLRAITNAASRALPGLPGLPINCCSPVSR